jgi:D-alanyl-D-alanine carboxypeptidase
MKKLFILFLTAAMLMFSYLVYAEGNETTANQSFNVTVIVNGKSQDITHLFIDYGSTIKYNNNDYSYGDGLVTITLAENKKIVLYISKKFMIQNNTGLSIKKEIAKGSLLPVSVPIGIAIAYDKDKKSVSCLHIAHEGNKYMAYTSSDFVSVDAKKATHDLIFVNQYNPVSESFKIKAETKVDTKKIKSKTARYAEKTVCDALYEMNKAIPKTGYSKFFITSAIRSIPEQARLFNSRLKKNQETKVANPYDVTHKRVAVPGTSEHHTGLALDIACLAAPTDDSFVGTKESYWLKAHCYKYGFIIRYPNEKQKQTYAMYEPWHLRYVGKVHSEMLNTKKICYEEYAGIMINNGFLLFENMDGKKYIDLHIDNLNSFKVSKDIEMQTSRFRDTKNDYIVTIRLE